MAIKCAYVVGDIVRLKSGGPSMTVHTVYPDGPTPTYAGQWFAGKKLEKGHFPEASLELVKGE